ncbi:phospholipid phosphatase 1 [Hydra vulgaris]|uniref:phospholipid phosphatase 1 n=1 Tax=Hydra vulgaris TaxID=6087 RepID=UPI001F5F9A23|nr:phospholipid phosphatase 1 [Hydra vulgaris]
MDLLSIGRRTANWLVIISLSVIFYIFGKVLPSFKQGFFCDDETIKKPYVSQETIPFSVLLLISTGLIVFVVCLTDCINFIYWKKKNAICEDVIETTLCCFKISNWISRLIKRLWLILCGALIVNIITNIGKVMVGRLRPHFLTVCQPDYSKFNCSSGYITSDVCTGDIKKVIEARKSFPSGHTSYAIFVAVLLSLYIEYVVVTSQIYLLKPFAQLTLICLGLACSFTRISDYFHHWSDVLAGLIIGTLLAYYTIFYLMNLPHEEKMVRNARINSANDYHDLEIGSLKNSSSNYQSDE